MAASTLTPFPSLLPEGSGRKAAMPSGVRPVAPLAARAVPILQPQRAPTQLPLFPPPGALRSAR